MNLDCKTSHLIVAFIILLWEWWIGRTQKLRANSTVELIIMGVAMLAASIIIKWKGFKNEPKH